MKLFIQWKIFVVEFNVYRKWRSLISLNKISKVFFFLCFLFWFSFLLSQHKIWKNIKLFRSPVKPCEHWKKRENCTISESETCFVRENFLLTDTNFPSRKGKKNFQSSVALECFRFAKSRLKDFFRKKKKIIQTVKKNIYKVKRKLQWKITA
jgi:hypothetical protein